MIQPMQTDDAEKLFVQAQEALDVEDTLTALAHIERALALRDHPEWHSCLGFCIAKERGQHRRGIELCQSSLKAEPDKPDHFLNLGRIHLIAGDKAEALKVMRDGMTKGGSPQLARMLERLGTRRRPVVPSLSRYNPINKYLGILLNRLGYRK